MIEKKFTITLTEYCRFLSPQLIASTCVVLILECPIIRRFGRKVWHSLPKEVLEEDMDLVKLEGVLDDDKPHIRGIMNTW